MIPIKSSDFSEKDKERFWDKVDVRGEEECWEWTASKRNNYGLFDVRGKPLSAHRISWVLENGPIPDGLLVLHKCDNPPCENPRHLFIGTQKDNRQDAANKGRAAYGEKNGNSKLTKTDVLHIRRRYSEGETQMNIAKSLGVQDNQISRIVNRKSWVRV